MKKLILAVMYDKLRLSVERNRNFFNCVHHCEDYFLHLIITIVVIYFKKQHNTLKF